MLWGKQELRLPDLPAKEKGPRAAPTKGFRVSVDVEPLKLDSMDALKAHAAAPHMGAYGAATREFIASRVIHIMQLA